MKSKFVAWLFYTTLVTFAFCCLLIIPWLAWSFVMWEMMFFPVDVTSLMFRLVVLISAWVAYSGLEDKPNLHVFFRDIRS